MKIWVDDVRPAPSNEWIWIKSVNGFKNFIYMSCPYGKTDLYISIDHDAGEYAKDGGDYIKILDWLEEIGYKNCSINIHSMNPVGRQNMMVICRKNGWKVD